MVNIGTRYPLDEIVRRYDFGDYQVTLDEPIELVVRPSGDHRIRTGDGNLHIIAPGWIHIEIKSKSENWVL